MVRIYLIGSTIHKIADKSLPTLLTVLKQYFYYTTVKKLSGRQSAIKTIEAVFQIWKKFDLPTQIKQNSVRKLLKQYSVHRGFVKMDKARRKNNKIKINMFKQQLNTIFDVSSKKCDELQQSELPTITLSNLSETYGGDIDENDSDFIVNEKKKKKGKCEEKG